jgi:hypothetical protein
MSCSDGLKSSAFWVFTGISLSLLIFSCAFLLIGYLNGRPASDGYMQAASFMAVFILGKWSGLVTGKALSPGGLNLGLPSLSCSRTPGSPRSYV